MQVEVRSASLRFGPTVVFQEIDAFFGAGKVTALVGPSGSGKTSLLAVMAGLLTLEEGTVRILSHEEELPPSPSLVAWVPQGSNALSRRSVLDNVRIASQAAGFDHEEGDELAIVSLEIVGLGGHLTRTARTLSGGELQRLALARALASRKPLIFADEPSANLDSQNTEMVIEALAGLRATATVIVATHDLRVAEASDAVVELRHRASA